MRQKKLQFIKFSQPFSLNLVLPKCSLDSTDWLNASTILKYSIIDVNLFYKSLFILLECLMIVNLDFNISLLDLTQPSKN